MKIRPIVNRVLKRVGLALASGAPRGRMGFAGAVFNRLTADWIHASTRSANQDLRGSLRTLRARSREIVRNTALGARYHQLVRENVVGPHGIRLQAKNAFGSGKLYESANKEIERAWEAWSRQGVCDASGKLSLTQLLQLIAAARAIDGEVLIRKVRGAAAGNAFDFALHVMDPDLLDDQLERNPIPGKQNAIRQGVEIDAFDRPVAYWCYAHHPSEAIATQARVVYPAADIVHVFRQMRPGQSRGYPDLAPAIMDLKMLAGYIEATLVKARVSSTTMGSIETTIEAAEAGSIETGTTEVPMQSEPGIFAELPAGKTLKLWDPQDPSATFGPFVKEIKHDIATAVGVSYGAMTGDLSDATYSSMRAGLQPERDHWKAEQQDLILVLIQIFPEWMKAAIAARQLDLPSYDVARWQSNRWQPRGFQQVDPLKDTQSSLMEVGAGVHTLTAMAAEEGRDIEDVLRERRAELDLAQSLGVDLTLDANPKSVIADTQNPDAANDDNASPKSTKAMRLLRTAGTA